MKHVILMTLGAALFAAPAAQANEDNGTLQAIGQGRARYLVACARCHGVDAKGEYVVGRDGEVVAAPDLTGIELRDGRFDPVHVANHIDGSPWGTCTADMPCWRQVLRRADGYGPAYAQLSTWKMTKYLQSIQETPFAETPIAPASESVEKKGATQAISLGRAHYLVNCAKCHGADAQGQEWGVGHNGQIVPIPDLTTIALRDGKFAPVHVAQHIDGQPWGACTAGMPCWQQINRSHGPAYAYLQTRNLTRYLESIQQPPTPVAVVP